MDVRRGPTPRRIDYAGSVHDEREIEAVVEVLRGGPQALRIGRSVRTFERAVAELFGKARGIMCNSGSSALYLAVELLDLSPGDEVITPALTFSTDVAPLVRSGLVPVFVDVERDTYNVDVDAIEPMIGERTRAILVPNLIGNVPDWDRIRQVADAHGLRVVEDSCDALGSTLRGTPTGVRSDISVTSFALSHIITAAGTGGMVCVDDPDLADRCLLLRRWGRRSEVQIYGSTKGVDRRFFSTIDGDLEYDNLFIFDEVGWNFEPSELSAAFGLVQLEKLPANLAARTRNFARLCERFGRRPDVFELPRTTDGVETAWHMFPVLLREESGVDRGAFQAHMEAHGIDTRMVWTGNALRQPAFRAIPHRRPEAGLPNTDRVMERGLVLPSNHSLSDEDVDYVWATAEAFLA
jgi:CDP-6-deoxy-D-xylo-4-hexulose-3-dehydrase